jgi:hypothetical protein
MSITFQKRQKEMKRQEKQRAKAEKRAQKKEAKRVAKESGIPIEADISPADTDSTSPEN